MEYSRLQNCHDYGNKGEKFSRLDLDSGYVVKIYLLYVRLSGQLYLKRGSLKYWRHGNNPIPEQMK